MRRGGIYRRVRCNEHAGCHALLIMNLRNRKNYSPDMENDSTSSIRRLNQKLPCVETSHGW